MTIDSLRKLIKENLAVALNERQEKAQQKSKIKKVLTKLISEALEERKKRLEKSHKEIESQLDKEVKKINKDYSIKLNDAGNFELCECDPYHVDVRPRWEDNFEVLAYKDSSDRTKKIGLSLEEVVEFLKEYLKEGQKNYVDSAYQKSVDNSKDKELKKKKEDGPQETEEKVENAVEKKEDLPDQPMQDVNLKKIEKQSDHSINGEKVKYKAPKKSDDSLTVKFK